MELSGIILVAVVAVILTAVVCFVMEMISEG